MSLRGWGEKLLAFQRVKVAATVLFHSTCAIAVTLVGKAALNGKISPVALLAVQALVQTLLLTIVGLSMDWIKIQQPREKWRELVPLALARTTGALAKTACLAVVDASFYQIARGLLLPFTLILSFAVLGKKFKSFAPLALFGACCVIVGFGIGMTTDILLSDDTNTTGLILGVGSSFTTAVESVVIKRFMTASTSQSQKKGSDHMMQMVWMSNVLSAALYAALWIVAGRGSDLAVITHGTGLLPTLVLSGIWGFLLTIATFLQISVTSPVTHMIVTAARGVAQSAFAVMLLPHESLDAGRLWSMVWILGGSALYGWAQDNAMTRLKTSGHLPLTNPEVAEKGGSMPKTE